MFIYHAFITINVCKHILLDQRTHQWGIKNFLGSKAILIQGSQFLIVVSFTLIIISVFIFRSVKFRCYFKSS